MMRRTRNECLGLALAFAAGLAGFCVALTAPPLDLPPPPMAGPGEEVAVAGQGPRCRRRGYPAHGAVGRQFNLVP